MVNAIGWTFAVANLVLGFFGSPLNAAIGVGLGVTMVLTRS